MNCGLCCGIFKGPEGSCLNSYLFLTYRELGTVSVSHLVEGVSGSLPTSEDRRGSLFGTGCGKRQNFRMSGSCIPWGWIYRWFRVAGCGC